jgi:hypothetical protein
LKYFAIEQNVGNGEPYEKINEVFKNVRSARPQPLGRAERMEEYVSTAKGRERRWRLFSTLQVKESKCLHK